MPSSKPLSRCPPPSHFLRQAGCMSPEMLPPIASMVEAFRRCCVEVSPLVSCATIPPRHINNFVEYQVHPPGLQLCGTYIRYL